MREIEVKILEIDKEKITKRIIDLGGKKTAERMIIADFYDFPDKRLRKKHEFIRIRRSGDENEIVYKCRKDDNDEFKIYDETETNVDDAETMKKILELSGVEAFRHTEKKRTSFVIDDVKIEIDEYPGIPPLLEVEGPTEESVKRTVEMLGYSMGDTSTMDYNGVLEKYGKTEKIIKF